MKTAEEWRKHFKVWAEEWASDKEVQTIQLDAMREGMRLAADKMMATIIPQHSIELLRERNQAILSAAEQLTEKGL